MFEELSRWHERRHALLAVQPSLQNLQNAIILIASVNNQSNPMQASSKSGIGLLILSTFATLAVVAFVVTGGPELGQTQ